MLDALVHLNADLNAFFNFAFFGIAFGFGFTMAAYLVCRWQKWAFAVTIHLHSHFGAEQDQ